MGIEPTTSGTTNQRSNRLSYGHHKLRAQSNKYSPLIAMGKKVLLKVTTKNTPYHILFLSSWFPNKAFPTLGNFVKRHAQSVSTIHQVSVLYIYPIDGLADCEWEVEQVENYTQYILYYPKKRLNILHSSRAFKVALQKFEAENERKVDMIHLNVLYPASRQALFLARKWRIPFIATEHWTGFHADTHSTIRPWQKALMRAATKAAAFVCPVSEHLAKAMQDHGLKGTFKVVPNVVDTELFTPLDSKDMKQFTFLHVSSLLDQHKNVSGLLRAFRTLAQKHPNVRLKVVGDGDIRPHQKLAIELGIRKEQIEFRGEQPLVIIAELMREANGFVLFSNYENLPCVIGEAFASGTPVISTDVGGISEHMPNFGGKLISKGNESELTQAMEEMLQTTYSENELRSYAETNFSVKAIAKAYNELYTEALKTTAE